MASGRSPECAIVTSTSAAARLDAARRFVLESLAGGRNPDRRPPRAAPPTICAREIGRIRGATFGLYRFSLTQLAARLAAPLLARDRLSPTTALGVQAVAARALFDARRDKRCRTSRRLPAMPGFPARARADAGGTGAGDGRAVALFARSPTAARDLGAAATSGSTSSFSRRRPSIARRFSGPRPRPRPTGRSPTRAAGSCCSTCR